MKITCDVIKDLMPLYVDEVLSRDSNALVEEHMAVCCDCKTYYKSLKADDNIVGIDAAKIENNLDEMEPLKKIKKRLRNRSMRLSIIAGFAVLLFIGSVLFGIQIPEAYNQCLGERIFDKLGWAVYSEGTEGWYYPGIISIAGILAAIGFFSWTRKEPLKILNLLLSIFLVIAFVSWIF